MKRLLVLILLLAAALPTASARAAGVTYAAGTVLVPRSVVRANLIGERNGTFRFRTAAGALARLAPGKVMVLQGRDAAVVKSVTHAATGALMVATVPAKLSQIIESGTIPLTGSPNWRGALTAPIVVSDLARSVPAVAGWHPPLLRSGATQSLNIQGGYKGVWGYSITGTPHGPHALDISGTICMGYKGADDCGNGPATAVALEIEFTGSIDFTRLTGALRVAHGKIAKVSAAFKDLVGNLHMDYTFSRGDGSAALKLPKIHIPIGWDVPLPNPYVPLFVRVQFGALLQVLSHPAKNTVLHGAMTSAIAGSPGTNGDGAEGSGDRASTSVSAGTQGLGISLAPIGIAVTLQEKFGIALGVSAANAMVFTDLTDTVGQTHQSALAGGFCSSYLSVVDWGMGVGYELGLPIAGLNLQKRWSLLKKTARLTEPGCDPIPEVVDQYRQQLSWGQTWT